MKTSMSKKVLVATIIILFVEASLTTNLSGNTIQTEDVVFVNENSKVIRFKSLDSLNIASHLATQEEIDEMKVQHGVYDPSKKYFTEGKGTGLVPPTEDEWDSMVGRVHIVDHISPPGKCTYIFLMEL